MSKSLRGLLIAVGSLLGVILFQFLLKNEFDPESLGVITVPAYYLQILLYAGINILLAVSLNLISGFTGQFSMGHAGFMSVGGFTSAYVTTQVIAHFPTVAANSISMQFVFLGALTLGGLMAAAIGYLVGLPSLRLKGDYLAIMTLGFGEIIRVIFLNMEAVGGARGMTGIPPLANFGWIYGSIVVTVFCLWRILRSAHGRSFTSVREDEIAAEAMGINTTQAKVRAFVISSFVAGVAGGLFGHVIQTLDPKAFDFNKSFEIIIMVVLGGMGSMTGSAVAAVLLTFLREALRPLQEITKIDLRMVLYSLILIIMMLTRPNGLFGRHEITTVFRRFRRQKERLA